jgi:hypothetical protein
MENPSLRFVQLVRNTATLIGGEPPTQGPVFHEFGELTPLRQIALSLLNAERYGITAARRGGLRVFFDGGEVLLPVCAFSPDADALAKGDTGTILFLAAMVIAYVGKHSEGLAHQLLYWRDTSLDDFQIEQ